MLRIWSRIAADQRSPLIAGAALDLRLETEEA